MTTPIAASGPSTPPDIAPPLVPFFSSSTTSVIPVDATLR